MCRGCANGDEKKGGGHGLAEMLPISYGLELPGAAAPATVRRCIATNALPVVDQHSSTEKGSTVDAARLRLSSRRPWRCGHFGNAV